jgi:hypothetical protein
MQVLNQGNIQLLKLNEIKVVKRDYNVSLGKNTYAFQSKVTYFFSDYGNIVPCKSLNRADVTATLLPGSAANDWLNDNKNKLKNEKDVVNFLAYYNTAAVEAH